MSDEIVTNTKIVITTTAAGDGAEKTAAGLEKDVAATKQLTAANEELAASQKEAATARGPAWTPGPLPDEAGVATEQEKVQLQEKGLILATRRAQIEATINGDVAGLAKLRAELAIRQQILAEMQREGITQEELSALVEEETLLINQSTAAIEARMAAEAEENAMQSRGALGMRGMRGMVGGLGEEMGLGALGFQLVGVAYLVETVWHLFEHHGEAVRKAREEQEKLNDAAQKESDQISKIENLNELESRRAEILENITELNEKRSGAEGEEFDNLTAQIGAQEEQLDRLNEITSKVVDREEKEEQTKQTLDDQLQAITSIDQKYDDLLKKAQEILRTNEKIEEIQLGAEIAAINRDERDGKITHEQAEQQRLTLQHAAEKKKFDDDQLASARTILTLSGETDATELQAKIEDKKLKAAGLNVVETSDAAHKNQSQINAVKDAEALQQKIIANDRFVEQAMRFFPDDRAAQENYVRQDAKGPEEKATALADLQSYYNANQTINTGIIAQGRQKSLDDAAKQAAADFEDQKSAAKTAAENAKKVAKDNPDKIAQVQQTMQGDAAAYDATVKAQGPEDADKLDQARKRDQEEKRRKQEAAKHDQEEAEQKRQRQIVDQSRSQASSAESSGSPGQMYEAERNINTFIRTDQKLSASTIDALQKISAALKAHEQTLNTHQRAIERIKVPGQM